MDDISGILAGVDDDFDVLDGGCCPWRCFAWSAHALRELCLKFGRNSMSLKATRTASRLMTFWEFLLVLMMILMFLTGAAVLDDVLHGLHIPRGSYVENFVEIR